VSPPLPDQWLPLWFTLLVPSSFDEPPHSLSPDLRMMSGLFFSPLPPRDTAAFSSFEIRLFSLPSSLLSLFLSLFNVFFLGFHLAFSFATLSNSDQIAMFRILYAESPTSHSRTVLGPFSLSSSGLRTCVHFHRPPRFPLPDDTDDSPKRNLVPSVGCLFLFLSFHSFTDICSETPLQPIVARSPPAKKRTFGRPRTAVTIRALPSPSLPSFSTPLPSVPGRQIQPSASATRLLPAGTHGISFSHSSFFCFFSLPDVFRRVLHFRRCPSPGRSSLI